MFIFIMRGLFSALSISLLIISVVYPSLSYADDIPSSQSIETQSTETQNQAQPNQSVLNRTSSMPILRIEVITDLPLQLGGGILAEWAHGLQVSTSLGWLPQKYVQGISSLMTTFEIYGPETAELIEATIQNSLVWRTHLGWRPWSDSGFYTRFGYTLITLGGGATTKALIEGITGTEVMYSNERRSSQDPLYIDASSSLHLLSVGLGWDWKVYEYTQDQFLFIRTALEWSYTFTSTAHLESQTQSSRAFVKDALDRLEQAGEQYLLDTFNRYIHPPSLTFAVGYTW